MVAMYFFLLPFVGLFCTGLSTSSIPAPSILSLTTRDPFIVDVEWTKVVSDEPILGYKLNVWEVPMVEVYEYQIIVRRSKLVKTLKPPQISDIDRVFVNPPSLEILTDSGVTKASVEMLKKGVRYQFKVLAFTKNEEGPLSSASGVTIGE